MQKYFVVSILRLSGCAICGTHILKKIQNPLILCGIKSTIFGFFRHLYSEDYIPASSQSRKKIRYCLGKVKSSTISSRFNIQNENKPSRRNG